MESPLCGIVSCPLPQSGGFFTILVGTYHRDPPSSMELRFLRRRSTRIVKKPPLCEPVMGEVLAPGAEPVLAPFQIAEKVEPEAVILDRGQPGINPDIADQLARRGRNRAARSARCRASPR